MSIGNPDPSAKLVISGTDDSNDYPDFTDAYISYAEYTDGTPLNDDELDQLNDDMPEYAQEHAVDSLT
jgi:hypothetical protein